MKSYKGFDKDLKCRGFQYEIGGEYKEPKADLCKCGFHACEMPLDVFKYYNPSGNRFCEVEQGGALIRDPYGSKAASTEIKIGAEIGIHGLVKAQVEWVKKTIGFDDLIKKAEESSDESATGYKGAASATGDRSASSATGNQGASSATGDRSAASATGDLSAASATGEQGVASATGTKGVASATGDQGAASATGEQGVASAAGTHGAASATGLGGIAIASGYGGKVMGSIGCAIVCCERGEWNGTTYPLISVVSGIVDGVTIKENTWYTVKDGKFVEVSE